MNTNTAIQNVQDAVEQLTCPHFSIVQEPSHAGHGDLCDGNCTKARLEKTLAVLRDSVLMLNESETERGNIWIVGDDGGHNVWICLEFLEPGKQRWLEISIRPDNYPGFNMNFIDIETTKLADFIRENFAGWTARKMGLDGVSLDHNNMIIGEPK